METANKLTYLSTKFFTENKEEYRITVTVSLNDDCHNNMCDWSVTADIRRKNKCGTYGEYMGGCCHNEVAKHFSGIGKIHIVASVFCDMITERIEKYEKRMSYDKGELNN